ncbi:MAG: hypothetical protein C4527_29395 [Candidatus Omnitrophota bacterium]|jgi:hypothetical protein|nr:MAG: hypothetical protein C4527_29395 [Candidatus Omnitrophota bacterium]
MRKRNNLADKDRECDTMRPEYDFSDAVRGVTATRYAKGTNVVVIERDVLDVFPDSATVNEALRALAPVIRHRRKTETRSKSDS